MDQLSQDLRNAYRSLASSPAFTVLAVLTLAIAIGANTAIFSLVNGTFFKGVPGLEETDQLVEVSQDVNGDYWDLSYPVFSHLRRESRTVDDLAAFALTPVSIGEGEEPTVNMCLSVTGNYFDLLRLKPSAGSFFDRRESFFPQITPAAVISHRLWEERFRSDPDVLGRPVLVNDFPVQIVGVAPDGFAGHSVGLQIDLWVLMGTPAPGLRGPSDLAEPSSAVIEVLGRLKPGVNAGQAQAELTALADSFMSTHIGTESDYSLRVGDWGPVPSVVRSGVAAFFAALMVIMALVLTMASLNVANMILSRTTRRLSEIAVRLAVGASRGRVIRQLLTESIVLFLLAGVAGSVFASWAVGLLTAFEPPLPAGIDIALDLRLDFRVWVFSLGISATFGILFTSAPAMRVTSLEPLPGLKERLGGLAPSRSRLSSVMVALQTAVTLILLVCAGLFLRALDSMKSLDPGWKTENVQALSLDLELKGYTRPEGLAFYRELTRHVRDVPGIESSSIAAKLPLAGSSSFGDVNVNGLQPPEGRFGFPAYLNRVSPGYFRTLGIPLLAGRDISDSDSSEDATIAVINRAMSERLWPNEDPIGRRFWVGQPGQGQGIEVVGIVENVKYRRLIEEVPNFYYMSYQQLYNSEMTLHYRIDPGNPANPVEGVRSLLRKLDPGLPILRSVPLSQALDLFYLPQRMAAWISGIMGGLGLLLAAVGMYGVTSFWVGQRTHEIGVRLALGGRRIDVVRLILKRSLAAPGVGMLVGLIGALAVSRLLTAFILDVSPFDPLTLATVLIGLVTASALAILIPVSRASLINPATTLRSE